MRYVNRLGPVTYEECFSHIRGVLCKEQVSRQAQMITLNRDCGVQLIVPVIDTCFWHNPSHLS